MYQEKVKCIVVDDEFNSREVLKKLLSNYFSEQLEVIGEARDVDEAESIIVQLNPDVVFLDIQMPGGDGFSLLKKFENRTFFTVFVTSFDHHAIHAIKADALDYLLKPIIISELEITVRKIVHEVLKTRKVASKILSIHANNKVKFIKEEDIIYIEASGRYSIVYTQHEQLTITKNLKDLGGFFGEQSMLVRISKSFIINPSEILEYTKGDPFLIKLSNGKTMEVSRRKKSEVLEKIKVKQT